MNGLSSSDLLSDERIIISSKDHPIKTMKIINDNNYVVEAILDSHVNEVFKAIEIKENELISLSSNAIMEIWCLFIFKNIKTLITRYCDKILKLNEMNLLLFHANLKIKIFGFK